MTRSVLLKHKVLAEEIRLRRGREERLAEKIMKKLKSVLVFIERTGGN